MKSVSIIDYGMSNLLSICRAFEHIGAKVNIVTKYEEIIHSDYLVLPGVGAFPDGMNELNSRKLPEGIHEFVKTGKPLLGVCLGMQMLLSKGFEHTEILGLNLIEGEVLALPKDELNFKVPNINWHEVIEPSENKWLNTIFKETPNNSFFYFVHSYFAQPKFEDNILSKTNFGRLNFASAIQKNNVMGTQFHPEKSGKNGLRLIESFLEF